MKCNRLIKFGLAIVFIQQMGCDKSKKSTESINRKHEISKESRSREPLKPRPDSHLENNSTIKSSNQLTESLIDSFNRGGPQEASKILIALSDEQLAGFLEAPDASVSSRLLGIASLIFAEKSGSKGNPIDLKIIFNSRIEISQLQEAASIFFKAAQKSGSLLSPLEYSSDIGSGTKRDKVIESYYAVNSTSIDSVIKESGLLGFKEDTRNALEGTARSKQWSYSELSALVGTEYEDLIPLFTIDVSRRMSARNKEAIDFDAEWEAIKSVDSPAREKLRGYFISTVGAIDPKVSLKYIAKESESEASIIVSDPSFSRVVQRWTEQNPNECLSFVINSKIGSPEKNRLINTALGKWLSLDSISAGIWVSSISGSDYYEPAARKLASWLKSKGDLKSAEEWERTIPEN